MSTQSQHCSLLIKNCSLLTEDFQILTHQSIAILDQTILAIDHTDSLSTQYTADTLLDGQNKLFMPGLIDAHMHTNQQLLRGRITDELPMIWTRIMLPYESTLTPEQVTLSAQLAALEMIQAGTTAFADAGGSFMDHAAEIYLQSGLRASLTYSTMDLGTAAMKTTTAEAISRTEQLYHTYHGQANGLLQVFFSLRSLLSCSEALIQESFHLASALDTGVHVHMNEYPNEINHCLEHFQKRPLEYLAALDVLGGHFLSAHSLFLSESEKAILAQYDIKVAHCPFSNCGKAIPDTPSLLAKGISVGLGTDGTAHGGMSLWHEMKIFRSIMNASHGLASCNPVIMPAKQILHMVTQGGADLIKHAHDLGKLKVGFKADLISIDLNQPHLYPTHNLINTLVESVGTGDVRDMIVNGQLLMKDRQILTLDQEKILFEARQFFNH